MATCTVTGPWDAVLNPSNFSEQQWQAANILILCQILAAFSGTPLDMSLCTVQGVWDAVQNPAYKSKQQFMAENISILCQILTALAGGGGGNNVIYWEDTGPTPSGPPPVLSIAWEVRFRDGNPPVVWDPVDQDWH